MRITILIVSILISITSNGQVIKGEIKASSNDTIPFAQIELINISNNETENATYADKNGVFTLIFTESDQFYFLKISALGFKTHSTDTFQKPTNFGAIILKSSENALDAIVIDITKPIIEKTGRGLNINIASSPLLESSNAKDILSKIPGVTMDQNGNFTLNGQRNIQVFINGKPSLVSVQQLLQQLEGTPGTDIEKIEVFNTPPARFDAEGSGGIINIIKKKSASKGFNGNVGVNTGMGKYPKSNSYFNFNYRNKKINFYGNINAIQEQFYFDQRFELNTQIDGTHHEVHNIKLPVYTNQNLAASAGFDYEMDTNTTIGILISPYIGDFNGYENLSARVVAGDYHYNKTLGYRDVVNTWKGNVYNLNFERTIKKGRMNFDVDYIYNFDNSDQITENDYWLTNVKTGNEVFTTNFDVKLKAITTKLDFEKKFRNDWNLESGAKFSELNQLSNYYNDFEDADEQWENALNFQYKERILAGYLAFNKAWAEKWTVDFGFRIENTIMDGKTNIDSIKFNQSFINLFPNTSISYQAHENWVHSLSYNKRIKRPEYLELTPFEQRINPYLISVGNPDLRPVIYDQLSYGLNFFESFNFSLNYGRHDNSIFLTPNSKEGEVIQRFQFQNLGEEHNLNATLNGPIKPLKRWLILWNATVFHNRLTNSPGFNYSYTSFHLRLQNQIRITKGWKAEFVGFYHHKHFWQVWQQNEFIQFDASFSKRHKSWKFNFTGTDIFGLRVHNGSFNQGAVTSINSFEPEKQVFKISIAYAFGNKRLKKQRDRGTSSDEVQERAK